MLLGRGFTCTPLAKLCLGARVKHYPKNQILLYGGDPIPTIYLLKKGVVKLYDIDHEGNEKVLHILKPPSLMPLTALGREREDSEWFYGTITDCDVYAVAADEFEKSITTDSKLATFLLRQNAEVMNELLVRLSSLGKNDARGKLAYVLRFLAECHAHEHHGGWRRVAFPVGHQLLADMIGMTRESTAISLKRLRERQIVRYPRATQLEIHLTHLITNEPIAA